MTPEELYAAKRKIEKAILNQIEAFKAETGLMVCDVHIETIKLGIRADRIKQSVQVDAGL